MVFFIERKRKDGTFTPTRLPFCLKGFVDGYKTRNAKYTLILRKQGEKKREEGKPEKGEETEVKEEEAP